jgi:hexulose-6-phosphate isomerase
MAESVGIEISGLCSFLFWPYSMTSNDGVQRAQGIEMAESMIEAAKLLGTQNVLVVPGAVFAAWVDKAQPVHPETCEARAREALQRLIPKAEAAGVFLNIENIFMNGFLFSPQEMRDFVDSFGSPNVRVHFDTGNIMEYQFPEHWISVLGRRIQNVHLKEWDRRSREFGLNSFRTLLDGTTNWPAVIGELDRIGYQGYLTFEYFHPFQHYPEALIRQTSDAMDWIMGRKAV